MIGAPVQEPFGFPRALRQIAFISCQQTKVQVSRLSILINTILQCLFSPSKSFLAHPCSACCNSPTSRSNDCERPKDCKQGHCTPLCKPGNCNKTCATGVFFMRGPTKVAHLKGLRAERLPSRKHSLSRRTTAAPLSRQRAACGLPAYTSEALHQPSLQKLL